MKCPNVVWFDLGVPKGTVYGKLTREAIHNDIACAGDGRPERPRLCLL